MAKYTHNPVLRLRQLQQAGSRSLRAYINAMCAYCMGCTSNEQGNGLTDHLETGFRTSIKQCTAPACPLFRFRPYQGEIASLA